MPYAGSLTLRDVEERPTRWLSRAAGAIGQGGIPWPR